MEITINDNKKEEIDIQIGDVFLKEDYQFIYMLVYSGNEYSTVRIDGGAPRWTSYNSFEEAKKSLSQDVEKGRLIHYSSSKYQLILEAKGQAYERSN